MPIQRKPRTDTKENEDRENTHEKQTPQTRKIAGTSHFPFNSLEKALHVQHQIQDGHRCTIKRIRTFAGWVSRPAQKMLVSVRLQRRSARHDVKQRVRFDRYVMAGPTGIILKLSKAHVLKHFDWQAQAETMNTDTATNLHNGATYPRLSPCRIAVIIAKTKATRCARLHSVSRGTHLSLHE